MNSNYFGIENLVDKLRKLFFEHLKLYLPGIYQSIKEKISESKKCLEALGNDYIFLDKDDRGSHLNFINQLVNKFCENYERTFAGKSLEIEENKSVQTIKMSYYNFLANQSDPPSKKIHNSYITEMIIRSEGDRLSGFPEADVFHEILNTEYDNIKQEANQFYENVYQIVVKTTYNLIEKYFKRFPPLKVKMTEIITDFIDENYNKMKYICNSVIEMNISYLFIDEKDKFDEMVEEVLGIKEFNEKIQQEKDREKQGGKSSAVPPPMKYNRKDSEIEEIYLNVSKVK